MLNTLDHNDLPDGDPGLVDAVVANGLYEDPSLVEHEEESSPEVHQRRFRLTPTIGLVALTAVSSFALGMGARHRLVS